MMRRSPRTGLPTALLWLLLPVVAAAVQLPPEIQADRYLVRAERAIDEQDFPGAKATMAAIAVAGAGQASARSFEVQPAAATTAVRPGQNRDRAPATTDTLDFGDDAGVWARDGECDDPRFSGEGAAQTQLDSDTNHDATDCRSLLNMGRIALREEPASATVTSHVEDGELDADDERLNSGEFIDSYILDGCAGDKAIVELRSEEFDPYLIVRTPSDELLDNDDYEGDANRSLLALKIDRTAPYLIAFTSFASGETGAYTFEIRRAEPRTLAFTASVDRADRAASAPPQPGELRVFDGMEFVRIPAGEFQMGSAGPEADDWEQPVTRVQISRGFWLGKHEVTQAVWREVMGANPAEFTGCGRRPVESVSWNDVQDFIRRLNARSGGDHYRLPTEAEWEYAARAGTTGERYAADLDAIAWYGGNSGGRTHPVGTKAPNPWGLHDMLGNVWELVQDWHGEYPGGFITDPRGPADPPMGRHRVGRGGSWGGRETCCRASQRSRPPTSFFFNFLGFRLLRVE